MAKVSFGDRKFLESIPEGPQLLRRNAEFHMDPLEFENEVNLLKQKYQQLDTKDKETKNKKVNWSLNDLNFNLINKKQNILNWLLNFQPLTTIEKFNLCNDVGLYDLNTEHGKLYEELDINTKIYDNLPSYEKEKYLYSADFAEKEIKTFWNEWVLHLEENNSKLNMNKQAVLIIGSAGAGKSSLAKTIEIKLGAMRIDSDEFNIRNPLYKASSSYLPFVRENSSKLRNKLLNKCLESGTNFCYALQGNDYNKLLKKISDFKQYGYEVKVILVHCNVKDNLKRIIKRSYEKDHRLTPPDQTLFTTYGFCEQVMGKLLINNFADGYGIYIHKAGNEVENQDTYNDKHPLYLENINVNILPKIEDDHPLKKYFGGAGINTVK